MSQEELANLMGYTSRSTIAKIESGANDITQSTIVKFADVLNTSIKYLMDWDTDIFLTLHMKKGHTFVYGFFLLKKRWYFYHLLLM